MPPPLPLTVRTSTRTLTAHTPLQDALLLTRGELRRARASAADADARVVTARERLTKAKEVAAVAAQLCDSVLQSEQAARAAVTREMRAVVGGGSALSPPPP